MQIHEQQYIMIISINCGKQPLHMPSSTLFCSSISNIKYGNLVRKDEHLYYFNLPGISIQVQMIFVLQQSPSLVLWTIIFSLIIEHIHAPYVVPAYLLISQCSILLQFQAAYLYDAIRVLTPAITNVVDRGQWTPRNTGACYSNPSEEWKTGKRIVRKNLKVSGFSKKKTHKPYLRYLKYCIII